MNRRIYRRVESVHLESRATIVIVVEDYTSGADGWAADDDSVAPAVAVVDVTREPTP
ncbi:MAG: hypothetical protein M3467_01530 [Actinomycetota bacterium]|nr:hypothetical protein [Actinomycetota bacterium]